MKTNLLIIMLLAILSIEGFGQCAITSAPGNNCTFGDQINSLALNSIPSPNNSNCSTGGYTLMTAPVWTLVMGSTTSWSATTGSGTYDQGVGIWIDWNNDGSWANSEMVASTSAALSHAGTFTVPYSAVVNTNLRMRVMCSYENQPLAGDACTSGLGGYGETEDYNVYVVCPTTAPTLSIVSTNTHICIGESVTLTASGSQNFAWTGGVTNGVGFSPTSSTSYTVTGSITACPSVSSTAVKVVSVATTPLPVNASASSATICSGNATTLTATGASNYTWLPANSNGSVSVVSPQANTVYTVIGYNGVGCPGGATVSLFVNPVPTIAVAASAQTVCAGESATLTATGADTYTWDGGATGSVTVVSPTTAIIINVTGSAGGCSSGGSQLLLVTQGPAINASSSKTLLCVGLSATLTATGSNNYVWSTGGTNSTEVVSPTTNTMYTVASTSTNGCTTTKTITINVFTMSLTVSPPTSVCLGNSVTIQASGAGSYLWAHDNSTNNFAFVGPTTTTVYMVSAKINTLGMQCPVSNGVSVTVHPLPNLSPTATPPEICKGEKSIVSASGATAYAWTNAQSTATWTFTGNSALTFTYAVTGTDANGCENSATVSVKVDACTGLSEQGTNPVSIFPNPAKGQINVNMEGATSDAVIRIYSVSGNLVAEHKISGPSTAMDVAELAPGIYMIEVHSNELKIGTARLVKE